MPEPVRVRLFRAAVVVASCCGADLAEAARAEARAATSGARMAARLYNASRHHHNATARLRITNESSHGHRGAPQSDQSGTANRRRIMFAAAGAFLGIMVTSFLIMTFAEAAPTREPRLGDSPATVRRAESSTPCINQS